MVPKFLSKSQLVWNDKMWADYRRIYISSKTPISDSMVAKELDRLESIMQANPEAALVGHSLGGWWAANLATRFKLNIRKLVFWTPLADTTPYPIFNTTDQFCPTRKLPRLNKGSHKVYSFLSADDLIVPSPFHGQRLQKHFDSGTYLLEGGHFYQKNHQAALNFMKDWIEV